MSRRRRPLGGGGTGSEPPKVTPDMGAIPGAAPNGGAIVVAQPPAALAPQLARADAYAAEARAPNTKRAYAGDWRRFCEWAKARGLSPLPPDVAVRRAYVAWLADGGDRGRPYPLTTIRRTLTSIAVATRALGYAYPQADPDLTDTLAGIARRLGDRPKKKRALVVEMLAEVISGLTGNALSVARNHCLLSLGFFFAARRSELAGVDVEHVEETGVAPAPGAIGLRLLVPKSKNDPTGKGRVVGIPYARNVATCPVRLTLAWIAMLREHGVTSGPLLRHVDKAGRLVAGRLDGGSIARAIKRVVEAHGLPAADYGGHSLRRGFITSAARAKKPIDAICRTTRHSTKSVRVLMEYIEEASVLDPEQNAGAGLV